MSLDLYERESGEAAARIPGSMAPPPDAFTGFIRGTGMAAMRTFATAGSAITMGAAGAARILEYLDESRGFREGALPTDGTRLSERLFKFHDETIAPAIDYWTPKPGEVGVAGEVTGQLLATLPMLIASPSFLVAQTQLGTGAQLVREGVPAAKAAAVGATQAAGLGLGVWMPILGQNLWQRIVLGGAGFNVLQGAAMRGVAAEILEGEEAAEKFKAFDPQMLTLDVLLGAAFGSLAHLSPTQRAQGAKMWKNLTDWAKNIEPSEVDALAALRLGQHANQDSLPGIPKTPADVEAHVQRLKTALGQLVRDEPVDVSTLPQAEADKPTPRMKEASTNAKRLIAIAEEVRVEEGLPKVEVEIGKPPEVVPTPEAAPVKGTVAKPTEVDALSMSARQIAETRGDELITVGRDDAGNPVQKTVRQYLDDAKKEVDLAAKDAKLFEIAAACYLGIS